MEDAMNIMLDIETLDVAPSAVMLSIGMVAFDDREIYDLFYAVPDMQEQMDAGRTVNASTILWWMQQSSEARKVFDEQRLKKSAPNWEHYCTVLVRAAEFIKKYPKAKIYSYGGDFDIPILANAFKGPFSPNDIPWRFTDVRCFRTWCDDHGVRYTSSRDPRVAHHALDDAKAQANHMLKYWESQRDTPPEKEKTFEGYGSDKSVTVDTGRALTAEDFDDILGGKGSGAV